MRLVVRTAVQVATITSGLLALTGCAGGPTSGTTAPSPMPALPVPPPPCAGISLDVVYLGPGDAASIGRGELTLSAEGPETGLEFVRPYTIQVPDGGANLDIPGLRPTIGVFVSDLAFMPLGAGFRQTMTIEWISELEVRAGGPDCEPVSVSCDLAGCSAP